MFGKTVVLNSRGPSNLELFSADIREPNDPTIPEVDFTVPLRFEKYITPNDPCNIPPLPVLAYNPVIDNITTEYNGNSFTGTWLLDTGATISLISVAQATALGLTDPDGNTLIDPGNAFCNAADINKNGKTDLADYTVLVEQWRNSPFSPTCGDAEHPWPQGDLNRDCSVDFQDLRILAREWLNECNWLNWNCSGTDLNSDKIINFADYSKFINGM